MSDEAGPPAGDDPRQHVITPALAEALADLWAFSRLLGLAKHDQFAAMVQDTIALARLRLTLGEGVPRNPIL